MIPLHQELADIDSLSDLALFPSSLSSESVPTGDATVKDSGVVTMETTSPVSTLDGQGMDVVQQELKRSSSPVVTDRLDNTERILTGYKSEADQTTDGQQKYSDTIHTVSSIEEIPLEIVAPSSDEPAHDQVTVSNVDAPAVRSADASVAIATVSEQQLPLDESVSMENVDEYSREIPVKQAESSLICHETMQTANAELPNTGARQSHMTFVNVTKIDRTDGQLVVMPTSDGALRSSPRTLSGVDTPTSSQVNICRVSGKS